MQLKILLLLFLSSCSSMPPVTVYIANHKEQGFDFSDRSGAHKGFVLYTEPSTDKLVCLTQDDARALYDWYSQRCKEKTIK